MTLSSKNNLCRRPMLSGQASQLIPCQTMLTGTPDEIRHSVRSAIATLTGGGGLILAPDQPLTYPAENLSAMVEAAQEYGQIWKER
jgi:uroporphyrinogen-III decarboxylase